LTAVSLHSSLCICESKQTRPPG